MPRAMDAFDALGLAPTFDLDLKTLEQRYRDLQRQLHPDRFAQASAAQRRESLSRAVTVNDAYRALRDELKRAALLLARYGGDVSEQSERQAEPALLMEIMELREQLQEAKVRGDAAAQATLTEQVRRSQRETTDELRKAFEALAQGDARAREAAARALARLRYYRRFLDEVALLEDAL